MEDKIKIALLIDGDNAEAALIEAMLNEVAKFGRITIKRIYADWTRNQMHSWKDQLNKYAVRPIQKFSFTKGKNSTDTALIIDAMDILHAKQVDGFCIVSSDSDYTGISQRIREDGLLMIGLGRDHTPEAFVKSCDHFIYTESLDTKGIQLEVPKKKTISRKKTLEKKLSEPKAEAVAPVEPVKEVPAAKKKVTTKKKAAATLKKTAVESHSAPATEASEKKETKQSKQTKQTAARKVDPIDFGLIESAFNQIVDENTGIAHISRLSEAIRKLDPKFNQKNHGFGSFAKFCESLSPAFEIIYHDDKSTVSVRKGVAPEDL